jgi:hypothetical protein
MVGKSIKKLGRFLIDLNKKEEDDLRSRILIVDGSFILPNNFALIIRGVKRKFKNSRIKVLTFNDRKDFIKDNFSDVEVIAPSSNLKNNKHQLAIELVFLLCRRFDSVVLSSLDISFLFASIFLSNKPVFLHNRWLEWYRIRQRTLSDVFHRVKSTDKNRRWKIRGIKDIIKSLGRVFIILSDANELDIKSNILIEDNSYTEPGHVITAVRRAKEFFINPEITLLTFPERKDNFVNNFNDLNIVTVEEKRGRYGLVGEMYKMDNKRFDYVILTTLDIVPVLATLLFFRSKVLLYNRWHQWWGLKIMNPLGYLKNIVMAFLEVLVILYLIVVSIFILLRMKIRLIRNGFFTKERENSYDTT